MADLASSRSRPAHRSLHRRQGGPASDGGRFDVFDPATGDVIASVADGTVEDALAAVDAADARGRGLGRDPAAGAAEILRRAFELMTERGRGARRG